MRLHALEKTFTKALGRPLVIAAADDNYAATALCEHERRTLDQFTEVKRKGEWLRGRNALKQVLGVLDADDNDCCSSGCRVSFPHPGVSITHAGNSAYCVSDATASGIGIDYEPQRRINPKIARWFLDDHEQAWLQAQADEQQAEHLLRLWTVKEAAFKSYAGNKGRVLREFRVLQLQGSTTEVTVAHSEHNIRVASVAHDQGFLSVAVALPQEMCV